VLAARAFVETVMKTSLKFGRSYREWWFLGLIASAVALAAAGTALLIARHDAAVWFLLAAAVAVFSTAMSVVLIVRSRFEIEIRPQGFLLRDRHGEREFGDNQLICAGLSFQPNYSNGVLKSTTRIFDLWVEGAQEPEQIKLATRMPIGTVDPLGPFIERVHAHLYERANAALHDAESFEGEGWTLHDSKLTVQAGSHEQSAQIADLSAVDVFDNRLCVWRHGQDEPVLRIPVSSANTRVLQRLLAERIAPRAVEIASGDRLGRILFERKPDRSTLALVWLLPICTALVVVAMIVLALLHVGNHVVIGLPICFLLLLIWLLVLSQSVEFRVCEHGVRRKWLFRTRQIRYAEVDSFTYSAVRQYVKGAYAGTHFSLTFAAPEEGNWKKLTYSKTLRNADVELDHLRDHVSALIANRMLQQFEAHQAVAWTDSFRFLPEGLEYRAAGILGRKPPILIPYSQIYGYDADGGTFNLWVYGKKKPVAKENVNKPNFFPGYHLLARLLVNRPAGIETASAR
jgi:hypothetical protein